MNKVQQTTLRASMLLFLLFTHYASAQEGSLPLILPAEKPERELSAAMERNYDNFAAPRPEDDELFSLFKYTEPEGLEYNSFDGTITRRDPSKVLFAGGKYYVWYTHRHTEGPVKDIFIIHFRLAFRGTRIVTRKVR